MSEIGLAQPLVDPCGRGLIKAAPCPRELQREVTASRQQVILAACVLASSTAFIDSSAVTIALPNLRAALATDLATVQWVTNSYVLVLAALTLIGGALADTYGKARMLSLGCLMFGAASAACALSPSIGWLIAARVVQGTSAALVTPASLALIGAVYPKDERTGAIAVWAGASALASAAGPVAGGWLIESFGWQAVFWINPPISLFAIGLLAMFAPPEPLERRRFDLVGAALVACALGALAWALSRIGVGRPSGAGEFVPDTASIMGILFGLAMLAAYTFWERVTSHPMTPPRLAANRVFLGLNVATLLIYGALAVAFFLLPFDLVDRRGLMPAAAGAAFLPFTLSIGLLSRFFSSFAGKFGPRMMIMAGAVGASLAEVWMALAQSASLAWGVIAPQALLGISFAVLVAPLTDAVMSSESDEGLASGVNNAASRVAQLGGVALAAGLGSLGSGYKLGLLVAAALSAAGAATTALTYRPAPRERPRARPQ
jgi:EmrB/QacA subfamily drug resistance transporter